MREIIDRLTPEQEVLLSLYREKWLKAIALTQPIDREDAVTAIHLVYQALDLPQPKILFFDSPLEIVKEVLENKYPNKRSFERVYNKFYRQLYNHVTQGIQNQLGYALYNTSIYTIENSAINVLAESNVSCSEFWTITWEEIYSTLVDYQEELCTEFSFLCRNIKIPMSREHRLCEIDFCTSVLDCHCDRKKWEILRHFFLHCGFVLLGENVCFVSDRPRKIAPLDSAGRLHAEGEPAIKFADGFCVYIYHGERLPEKYGKVCPQQWRSQWLLSEEDTEWRQILMKEIGYEKICQELPTTRLDCWQDYTLLKVDAEIDVIPVHLLQKTYRSTNNIRLWRVPPKLKRVQKAIRWLNVRSDSTDF